METREKRYAPVKAYKDQNGKFFETLEEAEDSDLFYEALKKYENNLITAYTIKECIKICRKYFTETVSLEEKKKLTSKYALLLKEIRDEEAETGDTEVAHGKADDALADLLLELGFQKVVEVYSDIPKWYA